MLELNNSSINIPINLLAQMSKFEFLHFRYQDEIEKWYRLRHTDSSALNNTVLACKKQISIAPKVAQEMSYKYKKAQLPRHIGYQRLCIIYEKQKLYDEAIKLAKQAQAQGWDGDWEKRIIRLEKQLN